MTATLAFHDVANVFPLMNDRALAELSSDIAAHGLLDPICLHPDGRILDGRNRYLACERVGVEPLMYTWPGKGSPIEFVVSRNLHRRQLTKAQRVLAAAKIANLPKGNPNVSPDTFETPSRLEAAAQLDVSTSAIGRGRAILTNGVAELVAAVEAGTITVCAGEAIARLPHDEQRAVMTLDKKRIAARAEVIRNGTSPAAVTREQRYARMCAMAGEGYSSEQIAAALDIRVDAARARLKRAGVVVLADRHVARTRKHDPNRIVAAMALDAENLTADVKLIDFQRLDRTRIKPWLAAFRASRRDLDRFMRRLEKEM